jgi:hypothetical protein
METKKQDLPITLNLTIEPAALKRIVEEGRLTEFVDALSAQASIHIKAQVIDQVAKGAIAHGGTVSLVVGFDDGNRYGTVPVLPIPFPPKGIWEDAMHQMATAELVKRLGGDR